MVAQLEDDQLFPNWRGNQSFNSAICQFFMGVGHKCGDDISHSSGKQLLSLLLVSSQLIGFYVAILFQEPACIAHMQPTFSTNLLVRSTGPSWNQSTRPFCNPHTRATFLRVFQIERASFRERV